MGDDLLDSISIWGIWHETAGLGGGRQGNVCFGIPFVLFWCGVYIQKSGEKASGAFGEVGGGLAYIHTYTGESISMGSDGGQGLVKGRGVVYITREGLGMISQGALNTYVFEPYLSTGDMFPSGE